MVDAACVPNPKVARLEEDLQAAIDSIGLGPQGLGGTRSTMGVNIENSARHLSVLSVVAHEQQDGVVVLDVPEPGIGPRQCAELEVVDLAHEHRGHHAGDDDEEGHEHLPKTCAYVWTVFIGYFAMKKECE